VTQFPTPAPSAVAAAPNHYITLPRVAALVACALLAWQAYRFFYANKRDLLLSQISGSLANTERLDKALISQFEVADRAAALGAFTLGYKLDEVSARFRDGLSRVAETSGLVSVLVDHSEPQEAKNPVRSVSAAPRSLKSALQTSGPDFLILRGSVRGSGTIDQSLRAMALLQAQPWIHRVEGFSLRPLALREGPQRCEIRIDVATIYVPQANAAPPAQPLIALLDERANSVINAVTARGTLRKSMLDPPPAEVAGVVAPAAVPSPSPPPAPSAASPWRLTGLASGRLGHRAFFTNISTGETRTLGPGGTLQEITLISVGGEAALIKIGTESYELLNGQMLDSRRATVPSASPPVSSRETDSQTVKPESAALLDRK